MVILALDTTTATGSVALARDSQLLECRVGDPARTHGERLPGEIITLLEHHEMTPAVIDRYAVCAGPGSFTGLRVGLATVQALALVHARPVITVPALEALAYGAILLLSKPEGPLRVGAWMNAHRGEVFGALYELSQADSRRVEGWRPVSASHRGNWPARGNGRSGGGRLARAAPGAGSGGHR